MLRRKMIQVIASNIGNTLSEETEDICGPPSSSPMSETSTASLIP